MLPFLYYDYQFKKRNGGFLPEVCVHISSYSFGNNTWGKIPWIPVFCLDGKMSVLIVISYQSRLVYRIVVLYQFFISLHRMLTSYTHDKVRFFPKIKDLVQTPFFTEILCRSREYSCLWCNFKEQLKLLCFCSLLAHATCWTGIK